MSIASASGRILLKKGLNNAKPFSALYYSLLIGAAFLSLLAVPKLLVSPQNLSWKGVLLFIAIGLVAPPLVRLLTYIGIDRLGASRAEPIRAVQPIMAVFVAMVFLGEKPLWNTWVGLCFVVGGALLLSKKNALKANWEKKDLLYPFLAAGLAGAVGVLRKYSVELLGDPIVGAWIAAITALLLVSFVRFFKKTEKASWNIYLLASGILVGVTDVLDLWAYSLAEIHIVAPLMGMTPLLVIFLSQLFLREEEKVDRYVWLGCISILTGVQFVLWGRL